MTRKILLVDDDEDVLTSMRDVLAFSIEGAEVETASTGKEALAMMRKHRPDALITDYRMPGMDGLELAQAAHRAKPKMPIIMVTAFNDKDIEADAKKFGVRTVLHKPFDIDRLVAAIESGLAAGLAAA